MLEQGATYFPDQPNGLKMNVKKITSTLPTAEPNRIRDPGIVNQLKLP